jgi:uncharacterized protein (DUF433 family)
MASCIEIGTLIDRGPAIRGGRPKIAGTGLALRRIVGWYKLGMPPGEVALEFPDLTFANVHAALAYHHANQGEIEGDIAAEEATTAQWEQRLADLR